MRIVKKYRQETGGFTIIELLVATTVFSIVLVIFLSAFLRISQLFYKGINMSHTQETARTVLEDISDDLQFYQRQPTIGSGYFCIGNHRYAYNLGYQVGSSTEGASHYAIARETMSVCKPLSGANGQAVSANHDELLDPGMQVNKLKVTPLGDGTTTVSMLVVFYGSDKRVFTSGTAGYINDINNASYDAYKAPDATCTGPPSSSQYCATAEYDSTILQSF